MKLLKFFTLCLSLLNISIAFENYSFASLTQDGSHSSSPYNSSLNIETEIKNALEICAAVAQSANILENLQESPNDDVKRARQESLAICAAVARAAAIRQAIYDSSPNYR